MFDHRSNTSSPSGALARGKISTLPSPEARSSSQRSTSSVQGSNSPEPSSAISDGMSALCSQDEDLGLVPLAEEFVAEGVQHSLQLAHVGLEGFHFQLEEFAWKHEVDG